MTFFAVLAAATMSGFIALSYEIIWIRVYSFFTEGEPEAFGFLLGAYLTGLAVGGLAVRPLCGDRPTRHASFHLSMLGWFLLTANVLGFLVVPAVAALAHQSDLSSEWSLPLFGAVAALFGTSLPLTAHYAIPPDRRAGARLSYLYVGNIVGSTAGSLATGFFLLDILTLRELSVLLAILGIFVSGALILAAPARGFRRVTTVAALTLIAAQIFLSSHDLYDRVYEKLLYRGDLSPSKGFAQIVENKSGVVSVSPSGTVYGNGSYDGVFNTDPDPARDVNRVLRAYLVSAFHERPANILMIGLGSGSWLQVLANYPDVKNITVVELNPGYVEVVRRSPEVVSALEHSKVDMVVDDGRRFLNRTDQKYDVIIQNTIVYWRSHATLLLSQEYLELTRSRLREGGVVYYNTTSSTASQRTGASIFPFAWRYQNMLIVSDSPIEINRERWGDRLGSWTIDGLPVLNSDVGADEIEQMLNRERWRGEPTWEGREAILARTRDAPIIRDDTMATEWWAFDTFP